MIRTLSTVIIAVLVSSWMGAILIDFIGPSDVIVLLTLLIAAALIRWPRVLTGTALILLGSTIPGVPEAVVLVGILLGAFVVVTWLRSLSPDRPDTHPRRPTRRATRASDSNPGAIASDPEALDLDTASVFSRSGLTNTHTTSDAGTAFDWRAYAAHLVRTYHQEHSREEIRAHRFAPREIRVQLFDQMAQQQGVKPTLGDAHFLNDLANATWIDFREREPPRTRGRINPRGTDGAPTPESTETPSGNSTHNA